MDDNLQRVFSILISTIIFFMLPLYIAFEKKDDISYALALKVTSNFVDEVKSKGYISKDMYDDYMADLYVTGNTYDVGMEHVAKKYYPVIYSYTDNTFKKIADSGLAKFDYSLYKNKLQAGPTGVITETSTNYTNLNLSFNLQKEIYTEDQILRALEEKSTELTNVDNYGIKTIDDIPLYPNIYNFNGKKYTMNIGDEFSVTIKNTNMTIASVLFNTLTFGVNTGNVPKVYIDYGGTIENEDYKVNVVDTNKTAVTP